MSAYTHPMAYNIFGPTTMAYKMAYNILCASCPFRDTLVLTVECLVRVCVSVCVRACVYVCVFVCVCVWEGGEGVRGK